MSFAIMRFEKLKTGGPISGSISHVCRTRLTPNADAEREHLNRAIVGEIDAKSISAAIEERTPAKFRRDAVRALEFVITATSDWFDENPDQSDAYFDSAVDWLKQQFGAENVVSAIQHNDELTPHMHCYVVPVDPETGRLNAKKWVGGRGKLRQMQTEFANHQAHFGVERGKPRPGRKHTRVRDWYDGHAQLDEREASLEAREREADTKSAEAAEERQAASTALSHARELHRQVELRTEDLDERQRQLAALEQQLRARGDQLVRDEAALSRRQAEIDRAGQQLQERLQAARQQQAEWEARRDAWLAEHRPPAVPEVVRHLQHLQSLSVLDAAEYLDEQDSDELYALFTPQDGLTRRGRELMAQHGDAAERREDWRDSGLDGPAPGL